MGAGKSTVGRLLSRSLKCRFIDSDSEIERRTGADIPWIFDVEGEAGFREREAQVIDELSLADDCVLATGGGAVLREDNRRVLRERGVVVYLFTPLEEQLRRTRRDRNRPLLQTDDPGQVLRDLFAIRDPLYREIAHVVVESDGSSPRHVAQRVIARLADFVGGS